MRTAKSRSLEIKKYPPKKMAANAQNKQPINCDEVGVIPSIQILEFAEIIGPSGFK